MSDNAKVREDGNGCWIYVRFQKERHYITHYMGRISFRHIPELARKSADVINSEIDRGIFRPERWKRRSRKLFNVDGYSKNWLESVQPSLSKATYHDYKNSFKNHINPFLGEEYIEDINREKLSKLQNAIQRAPKGKKNVLGAFHSMLQDAFINGHIPTMPIFPEMKGTNQIVKPKIKWLELSEQMKILGNIRVEHRPIFTFLMLTGCRPSEARAFRKEDIEQGNIVFAVTFGRGEILKEVKGKKIMPFPLTEALKELFEQTSKNLTPFVFINPETSKPYTKQFNRIFNRATRKAGVKIRLNEFGRKSFAMQMLKEMDRGIVSFLLRHQDPRMIDHYAEYQTDPIKSKLDKVQQFTRDLTVKQGLND